ncbi:TAP-like protein-domain-containing protein [Annulohypoxylon maeteangense]|uniref:TAP-like protein-domain-containing protein n=1 Tax=Annulohypoxylon maeteangense TaxID=1927788 RepID=UPI00200846A8|nr:TAP-like protein-domain-containing protein [Annulohypoxylon maeteangense]KAI0886732.1 TAP-like protein-domain-containing protein [Annulohypoxylon maeteangense]
MFTMVLSKTLTPLLLSLAAQGTVAAIIPRDNSTGIQWGPCKLNTTLPVQCAKLPVPLDYTDNSSQILNLDVIRYPAQKHPKRGSIILNFGGPGQDGLNSMLAYADLMGPTTGGYHDLVSWDPRGTGSTLRFSCWPDDTTGYFNNLGTKLAGESDTMVGKLWAQGQVIANQCYNQLKDTGDKVGMAFAARDMMSIVDALDEGGKLNYWGISGGTAMGATVAAMFPDRIERIVLDGVMNSHQYYNSFGEPEMVASTDATWEEFMRGCVATPQNCALGRNKTFEMLEAEMAQLFETFRNNPPVYQELVVVEYSLFVGQIFNTLYRPTAWPALADALNDILHGSLDSFAALVLAGGIPAQDQAILGIRCGDKGLRTDELSDLEPDFAAYKRTSKWFWDWAWGYYVTPCAQWKFHAKERYAGDFNVKTSFPMLVVGNTWDPVTPIVSARNMSEGFEGSVLLTHNGHGHLSLTQPSNCTNQYIQDYFLKGTLPAPGTVCQPNLPLFSTAA